MPNPPFQLTWARAWIASLLIAISAGLGIALVQWKLAGNAQIILLQVLSTLLSIGVIAFVYDVAVRRSYTRELIEMMDLSSELWKGGIKRIVEDSAINWRKLMENATQTIVVVVDGSTVAERDWLHILNASRNRDTDVRVFVPDPSGAFVDQYAEKLGHEPDSFRAVLTRTERSLEDSWSNAMTGDPPIRSGSKLRIFRSDFYISYPLFFFDQTAVALLPQAQVREPGQGMLALQFEINTKELPGRWLDRQRNRLVKYDEVPHYESPE